MLRKMLFQGLAATVLIAGAAGLYAAAASENLPPAAPTDVTAAAPAAGATGYLAPERARGDRRDGERYAERDRRANARMDRRGRHDDQRDDDRDDD